MYASKQHVVLFVLLVFARSSTLRAEESSQGSTHLCADQGEWKDPCRAYLAPGGARLLPPRICWGEIGASEIKRWSLTILTRPAMQHILFRGQLQESPPFLPPFSLVPDRLCDGSQTGGGQCHYGVTRSYLRGLQQVGHTFNFNPPNSSLYGDVIWALTSPACAAATSAKRERPAGEVFVVAGPQIGDIDECGDADMVIVPSLWVKDRYISKRENEGKGEQGSGRTKSSSTTARIVPLYAGVDTDFWRPRTPWSCKERQRIVLYDKSRVSAGSISSLLIDQIEEILLHTGRPVDVVRYGFQGKASSSSSPSLFTQRTVMS